MTENQAALIREAYRRTEKRLEAQLAVAIAFDQRSYVLAAVSIASAGFVLTGRTAIGSGSVPVGAAVFFIVSATLASLSALPLSLYTAGSSADELKQFIDADHALESVIYGLAVNNDRYIRLNDFKVSVRVAMFRLAVGVFCSGLILSALALNLPAS